MGNINAVFMAQIVDIAQREGEANIHHHGELDDLRRCLKSWKGDLVIARR